MRLVTPSSLRELAIGVRAKLPNLGSLSDILDQCAQELESRDAEIEGLKRALASVSRPSLATAPLSTKRGPL